MSIILNMTCH